ncbi:MAG: phosphoenolpyruvate carboxykinase (ATP) [Verrucomicrobia bacterium]|nr:phosphoenolpyruvate carboxykinase (ATP) [Verrucomicrobiota bacterium]
MNRYGLEHHGIKQSGKVQWNLSVAQLIEEAVRRGEGILTSTGALNAMTVPRTGRSPRDKWVVDAPSIHEEIWWSKVNSPIPEETYLLLREEALNYLNGRDLYVVDAVVGADPRYEMPIRIVTEQAWHALFVKQLFRRPSLEKLAAQTPEWVVINAGKFQPDQKKYNLNSNAAVILDIPRKTVLVTGTQYAGEMKKGIFTVLNYTLPKQGVLSMHCSANVAQDGGNAALFFGLSGTGKTTLSADPNRDLIGDDEHGWTDTGIFNFEGGCYAKCINLTPEREPLIWEAIKFGSVIENVVVDPVTRMPDYKDSSITENTRCAYPLDYIPHALPAAVCGHPEAIIFLAADAFGVLPPVARLTPEQAMYHFMAGYTAALAGTETNLGKDPVPTFSTCFGAPFLPLPPETYAKMLAEKMKKHNAKCYLLNSGWCGNAFGQGPRISLKVNRDNITQILDGTLDKAPFSIDPTFGFEVPKALPGISAELLAPRYSAKDPADYDHRAKDLAAKFVKNFEMFKGVSREILEAGPRV